MSGSSRRLMALFSTIDIALRRSEAGEIFGKALDVVWSVEAR
jgi:hypothetical protein